MMPFPGSPKIQILTITNKNTEKSSRVAFAALTPFQAVLQYQKIHGTDDNVTISAVPGLCEGKPIYEAHSIRYGVKFQTVHKGGITQESNEFRVKSPVLSRYDYNPINHSYLCLDGEGTKHYIDAYEWCIIKEEE